MGYQEYGIGATSVGIRGKDYVILAAERRVSYGGFVISKSGKKLFKITDRLGLACAGLFADMQNISKVLKANIEYYELVTGRPLSIKAAARLLASILYSNKLFPFLSETIVGGIDFDNTAKLYVMDPLGSLIEDDYAAIGSGAPIAIGVLEANYREDLEYDAAKDLIIKAIRAAIERDAISGDGIDILAFRLKDNQVVTEEYSITLKL